MKSSFKLAGGCTRSAPANLFLSPEESARETRRWQGRAMAFVFGPYARAAANILTAADDLRRRTCRYSATIMSVTDRAFARSAPAMIVADLKRWHKS
jgi:hypothetical protein